MPLVLHLSSGFLADKECSMRSTCSTLVLHVILSVVAWTGKESLLVAEVERVEVQMLITPDRLEAVPTRAAKDAPEEDSAPEGVRIALIAQAAPAPAAEGSAETDDTAPASVTKIAPAPKEVPSLACMHPAMQASVFLVDNMPCITSACACRCTSLILVLGCRLGESAGPWMGRPTSSLCRQWCALPGIFSFVIIFPDVQRCWLVALAMQALAPPAAVPATAARLKSAIKLTTSYDHRYSPVTFKVTHSHTWSSNQFAA